MPLNVKQLEIRKRELCGNPVTIQCSINSDMLAMSFKLKTTDKSKILVGLMENKLTELAKNDTDSLILQSLMILLENKI